MLKITINKNSNIRSLICDFLCYTTSLNLCENDIFNIKLIACELFSNAIKFTPSTIFTCECTENVLLMKITCHLKNNLLNIKFPKPTCENGRGLAIVKNLASRFFVLDGFLNIEYNLKKS